MIPTSYNINMGIYALTDVYWSVHAWVSVNMDFKYPSIRMEFHTVYLYGVIKHFKV